MARQARTRSSTTRSSSPASRSPLRTSGGYLPPSARDHQRYRAYRSGQTPQEIADREQVEVKTVESAILRVRIHNQHFSAEEVGVEVRQLFAGLIPEMNQTLRSALKAVRYEGVKTQMIDKESGEVVTLENQVERADHEIRLRAIDAARGIIAVVQPRDPAVQITSTTTHNTQNNLLGGGPGQAGALGAGMTSPEAVIRAIQAQRGYALGDGSGTTGVATVTPVAVSTKIIEAEPEARSAANAGDPEDEEYDEDEDDDEDDGEEDSDSDDTDADDLEED